MTTRVMVVNLGPGDVTLRKLSTQDGALQLERIVVKAGHVSPDGWYVYPGQSVLVEEEKP